MGRSTVSRRASEFVGVALFAAALIWIVSLASYEPGDPVWFFSTRRGHGCTTNPASRLRLSSPVAVFADRAGDVQRAAEQCGWPGYSSRHRRIAISDSGSVIVAIRNSGSSDSAAAPIIEIAVARIIVPPDSSWRGFSRRAST